LLPGAGLFARDVDDRVLGEAFMWARISSSVRWKNRPNSRLGASPEVASMGFRAAVEAWQRLCVMNIMLGWRITRISWNASERPTQGASMVLP
jgi:hypothetical protein